MDTRIAALHLERRQVAIAIFVGPKPEFTQTLQLPSDYQEAERYAVSFVLRILNHYGAGTAGIEASTDQLSRVARLKGAVQDALRANAVSIWEVPSAELYAAYSMPPAKTKQQLRQIVLSIWPVLNDRSLRAAVDAMAIGLYVQVQRLLSINLQTE